MTVKMKVLDNGDEIPQDVFGRIFGGGIRKGKELAGLPREETIQLQGETVTIDLHSRDMIVGIIRQLDLENDELRREVALLKSGVSAAPPTTTKITTVGAVVAASKSAPRVASRKKPRLSANVLAFVPRGTSYFIEPDAVYIRMIDLAREYAKESGYVSSLNNMINRFRDAHRSCEIKKYNSPREAVGLYIPSEYVPKFAAFARDYFIKSATGEFAANSSKRFRNYINVGRQA